MQSAITWTKFVAINAAIFAAIYLWKALGNDMAGNLVLFVAWSVGIAGIIAAFMPARAKDDLPHHSMARRRAGWFVSAVMVLVFAAIGHFALAAVYTIGSVDHKVWRDKFDADGKPLPCAD